MSHKKKKRKPYDVKTGKMFCPKCNRKQPYTLYTCQMPYYDETHDKNVTYTHAYGKCNICGTVVTTNKMRKLNNKAIRKATKIPYDWKAHALEKIRKEQAEQSEEQ